MANSQHSSDNSQSSQKLFAGATGVAVGALALGSGLLLRKKLVGRKRSLAFLLMAPGAVQIVRSLVKARSSSGHGLEALRQEFLKEESVDTIYGALRSDHRKVEAIFEELEVTKTEEVDLRRQKFEELKHELIVHSRAEEEVFYLPLRNLMNHEGRGPEDQTMESEEEHNVIYMMIRQINGIEPSDPKWLYKLKVLKELFKHHVNEEERKVFRQAHSVLTDEEAAEMAVQLEMAKEKYRQGLEDFVNAGDGEYKMAAAYGYGEGQRSSLAH